MAVAVIEAPVFLPPRQEAKDGFWVVRANERRLRAALQDTQEKLPGFFPPGFDPLRMSVDALISLFGTKGLFGINYFQVGDQIQGEIEKANQEIKLLTVEVRGRQEFLNPPLPIDVVIQIHNKTAVGQTYLTTRYLGTETGELAFAGGISF